MRRNDLAVSDPAELDDIILSCDCFRLAFADGTKPYIVPLSFGYQREDGMPVFYFHSAKEGRKVELSRKLSYAGFELDTNRAINENEKPCDFSVRYQSIIGEGTLTEITDTDEKIRGLNLIMNHYSGRANWEFPLHVLDKTVLFRLSVSEMSGKKHS